MKLLLIYWSTFAAVFAASMIAHDFFVFAEVRACIHQSTQNLSEGERHPTESVRRAFRLDTDYFYGAMAFSMYRDEYFRRGWDKVGNFHSEKIPATLTWAMALWVSVDRKRIESYRLRKLEAEGLSKAFFGKAPNALTDDELKKIWRAAMRRAAKPVCPW
jgi:hypothetical protein